MNSADILRNVADNPHDYARSLKDHGKSIIGYFCSYTPEEIILAAGLHPLRLFGAKDDTGTADAHLQAYCCSLVRGALSDVLSGRLSYLAGAVFPHTCDSIQRLSDIWRLNTTFRFFADVVLPVKLTTESSRLYLEDVLRKFRGDLEEGFSITITDDDLRSSIRTYNSIRSSLKTLYSLHSRRGLPGAGDLNAFVRGSMVLDRVEAANRLSDLVETLTGSTGSPSSGKKVILAGSVCEHPDIYRLIERAGADVVWDDMCTGSRYFEGLIDEHGDPLVALAQRYHDRVICPAKHSSVRSRGDNLVNLAREHGARGVIFLQLKFCDPHSFDYPYLKETLDKAGIPSMLLEIEAQLPPEGQLLTRFETFTHML
ncbi:MAG TPA: 2-hydroxyacyl-CoA dehydratase family protein [Deltaproteobacteria bacterium]|nr:2-hydroxyacyl-CoA dehydratase family protein [Deltaproteobacteria bacterium]HPR53686.1 2-hydroxyacyl-CoA dehydratase family protein [Deltaproteobacteria bacterium]HXK47202.1 2-hydroxyacyl-CoA dehydratase family protein [Deltaproteobacteria bacterium]